MKYLSMLIICLTLALFTFGIGAIYFAQNLTPEVFQINQETAKLKAETEKLAAEQDLINTKLSAYAQQQTLKTEQQIKATGLYRYSLAAGYAVKALWPAWFLAALCVGVFSQRARIKPKVAYKAEGIETLVPADQARDLVKEALDVVKLRHSEQILALSDDRAGVRLRENVQAIRALKNLIPKERPQELEPIDVTPEIPARSQTFSMSDLLLDPDLERGALPLGRNTESGACVQVDPLFATSFDIIGKPNHCKTTLLKMIVSGFLKLQDEGQAIDLHLVDPHGGLLESLGTFLKPVLNRFKTTVLGEQAIENGDHLALLETLESEATQRQEHGCNTPLQVLIIDEIHDVLDQDGGKDTYMLLKKLRRLRKAGFFQVIVWHDSTKEGQAGLGTGLMGLNVSAFVVNSTKSKAAKVLESEDADKAVNLPKGQAVLKLPGVDSELVNIPIVRESDLLPFIKSIESHAKLTPGSTNESQPEESHTLTPARIKQTMDAHGYSLNKTAELTKIPKSTLSNFLNERGSLSADQFMAVTRLLFEVETSNVIPFEQRAKRLEKQA